MRPELFLVLPDTADGSLAHLLGAALAEVSVAAVLVARVPDEVEPDYLARARDLVLPIQSAGAAALLDTFPGAVRELGADGVHLTGGFKAVKAAVELLKPDLIVGAGDIRSRHDAMSKGELDIDYLMFGTPGEPAGPQIAELARWWAETFEIPCVFMDENPQTATETGAEFVGIGPALWSSDAPADQLRALEHQLERETAQ